MRRDVEALGEVLLARADVEADQAGVGVLRREAVDGVGHATLLADLLEEARRRGAAEDRVEQRRGEAPAVGARDAGRADADVVLLRVLLLEAKARRRRRDERPAHARRPSAACPPAAAAHARASRDESSCSRFPAAETTMLPPTYIGRWYAASARRLTRRDHLARSDHRPPERVRRRRRPRRRDRARAPAACPRTSRSPRARPRAPSRAPRTSARRPCRSSRRSPSSRCASGTRA